MRWLPLLVALAAAGCGPNSSNETSKPESLAPDRQPVESTSPTAPKPRHPERVYQLDDLRVVAVSLGRLTIRAWLMDTPGKRQEGMMFLKDSDVADDQGMLFAFPAPQPLAFWMENTRIPLDIAYLDAERRIVSVHTMKPLDKTTVPSAKPAQYALEVKAGVIRRSGAKVGDVVRFDPTIRASE